MKNVLLLRNFKEDNRISMEVYAQNLYEAMGKLGSEYKVTDFRPSTRFSNQGNTGKWAMRYARYIEYPHQVRGLKSDVYHIAEHGYAHLLNRLPPERTVVTVHDLIPLLKYKNKIPGANPGKRPRLAEYSLKYLKNAGHIIAISENTKKDLIEHCGCRADKISVIYFGLLKSELVQSLSKSKARNDLGLPDDSMKLVLVTGSVFYKNLDTSVQIYNRLIKSHPNIRLVHLGTHNATWEKAKVLADDPNAIIEMSALSNNDVAKLYKAVDCILFPSSYEGFGLPPVEAMACGTPVVTSNSSSLPEAVGSAALTADPFDINGLAGAVETMLYDDRRREKHIHLGLDHAKQFTWERCAKNTQNIYNKVLEKDQ